MDLVETLDLSYLITILPQRKKGSYCLHSCITERNMISKISEFGVLDCSPDVFWNADQFETKTLCTICGPFASGSTAP